MHTNLKIMVGVNTLTSIASEIYSNHINFWTQSKKDFPDAKMYLFTGKRMSIDAFRNTAAKYALNLECDYLMFIDDDVLVNPGTLKSLMSRDADIAMALTFIRGYPFEPMFFKDTTQIGKTLALEFYRDYRDHLKDDGSVETYAVGFSCALIRCDILRRISMPYFITGIGHTEDVYFCCKCKDELDEVKIVVDTNVPTGHILESEYVSTENVESLREHYKPLVVQEEKPDRGDEYLKSCLMALDISN